MIVYSIISKGIKYYFSSKFTTMKTKVAENAELTKIKDEADTLIVNINNELNNSGPQNYWRLKGFVDRLNGLGRTTHLLGYEVLQLNKIVLRINDIANTKGMPYKIEKKGEAYELIDDKAQKKGLLIAGGRDRKEGEVKSDKRAEIDKKLKMLAKKGPIEK